MAKRKRGYIFAPVEMLGKWRLLRAALDRQLADERINKRCEDCQVNAEHVESSSFDRLTDTLLLAIERTSFERESNTRYKRIDMIKIPLEVVLPKVTYSLKAASCHLRASVDNGHWVLWRFANWT